MYLLYLLSSLNGKYVSLRFSCQVEKCKVIHEKLAFFSLVKSIATESEKVQVDEWEVKQVNLIVPTLASHPNAVSQMANLAIARMDLSLFQNILENVVVDLKVPDPLVAGWKTFGFDAVMLGYVS